MKYALWRNAYHEGYCILQAPSVERPWELAAGVSRLADFPDDFTCRMSPDYPKDIQLSDNLYGTTIPVISGRVKDVLESGITKNRIEFLPVQIINHKGRIASSDYYLLHPLDVCDCIDLARSEVQWNAIDPTLITRMKGMFLNEERIPEDYSLFRVHHMGYNILVREDVIAALEGAGLVGLVFREPEDYTGVG